MEPFGFFLETFVVTHPLFSIRLGHAAFAAGLRILDIAQNSDDMKGKHVAFKADDTRMMMKVFSAPPSGSDKEKEKTAKSLSAADLREMSTYESIQYRTFIKSIMEPLVKPPESGDTDTDTDEGEE